MKNLTLEISLKPFYGLDAEGVRSVWREALRQWSPLVQRAEALSLLFWAADGSEILEYQGDLDAPMEWARYIGNGNAQLHPPIDSDPEGKSLHAKNYLYREDAALITYRRFAEIARLGRETISALTGLPVRLGLTFDPGGEFAPSPFKYERHREICLADTLGKASFVCCYGVLDADSHPYAGFPEGIPQGTSLGTFLGRQFRLLAGDLGFDFLWLSNGFGFGMETWMTAGPLFDGATFRPEKAPATRDRILSFWRDFRRECPDLGVETRGTNLGTGTDLASDATPLRELYEGGFNFAPPPNSPWAAINGDFGIELAGYLSRIAELPPGHGIPFRFYLHDPWWLNSPWLDRYERQPHDIYLPTSAARINAAGEVECARTLNLLTIDDSYGRLPESVPAEVTPHLLRAWSEQPDQAGPLVWLYPFDELHDAMFAAAPRPERLFHNDWFVREAINDGVPVNTVLSTRAFKILGTQAAEKLPGRILLTPAPFDSETEQLLLAWLDAGQHLLIYGPLDTAPALRRRLNLASAAPLTGLTEVTDTLPALDQWETPSSRMTFLHSELMSGGGLGESSSTVPVCARQGQEARALAASCGTAWWVRGPLPLTLPKTRHVPGPDGVTDYPFGELLRKVLAEFGWRIAFRSVEPTQRRPVLTLHRHNNGWLFSGYTPDTTVELALCTPFGAPLLIGQETWIKGGSSTYRMPRGWRAECRVFVDQADGWIRHFEGISGEIGITRRLWLHGLKDATVRFFPPPGAAPVKILLDPRWPHIAGSVAPMKSVSTAHGEMLESIIPLSGPVVIAW